MDGAKTYSSSIILPVFSSTENIHDKRYVKIGVHKLSNLPLQVSLYFNLVFFPFWLLVCVNMIPDKFSTLPSLYQCIFAIAFGAVTVLECLRLYIGYKGNLKEKVSELAGFWLLTVLLQTPLQLFLLMSSGLQPSLLETLVQCIMCIFLVVQLIFGIMALRNAAKHSVLSFNFLNTPYESSPEANKTINN